MLADIVDQRDIFIAGVGSFFIQNPLFIESAQGSDHIAQLAGIFLNSHSEVFSRFARIQFV